MKKILLIEDDVEAQEIYKQILKKENFEVIGAINGELGLEAVKSQTPDLVILDIMLPGGLNGFDVLEQIKRDERTKNTPVIILTNLDTEKETAKTIGVVDYIVKTEVTTEDIINKVKSILNG